MTDQCQREAFDLFHPACRMNFKRGVKRGAWKKLWWVRLVVSDTWNRVCSRCQDRILVFPKGTIVKFGGIPCELLQDTPYESAHFRHADQQEEQGDAHNHN